jgi:hypothetical protein
MGIAQKLNIVFYVQIPSFLRFLVITQKPSVISKIWHGVKMISTSRSTYPAILK